MNALLLALSLLMAQDAGAGDADAPDGKPAVRVPLAELGPQQAGRRIETVGRLSSTLAQGDSRREVQLRLKDSPVAFVLRQIEPQRSWSGRDLRIVGDVRTEGSQVIVDVERIVPQATDLEQFRDRRNRLLRDDFESRYGLALWAVRRGTEHGQLELIDDGRQMFVRAAELQREQADTPEKLQAYVDRVAADLKSQDRLAPDGFRFDADEAVHDLLRREYDALAGDDLQARQRFAERLGDRLEVATPTDATDDAPPLTNAQKIDYRVRPVATYRDADKSLRPRLLRHWQVEILSDVLDAQHASGLFDELQLAERATQLFPDRPEIASRWLEQGIAELDGALGRVADPNEIEKYRDAYRKAGREDDWNRIAGTWLQRRLEALEGSEAQARLDARRKGLRVPEPNAQRRYDYAQLYVRWFGDRSEQADQAVRLARAALEIDPDFAAPQSLLRQLGREAQPRTEVKRPATLEGKVQPGASGELVLRLRGQPVGRTRVVTGGSVTVLWTYRFGNSGREYVRLRPQPGGGELEVTAVDRVGE